MSQEENVPFGVWQPPLSTTVTHVEMLRTQYLVFPNEPNGGVFIATVVLTACQRPLFLHPGLYF